MASFSAAQASGSEIQNINKHFTDGEFSHWKVRISGSDGRRYSFRSNQFTNSLVSGSSAADIKKAAFNFLTGSEYYVAPSPTPVSASEEYTSSIGSNTY